MSLDKTEDLKYKLEELGGQAMAAQCAQGKTGTRTCSDS